jgi:hypothetical protein
MLFFFCTQSIVALFVVFFSPTTKSISFAANTKKKREKATSATRRYFPFQFSHHVGCKYK